MDPAKPFITQRTRRRTIADLLDALKSDFEIRGVGSKQNLSNIKRAGADFGMVRATALAAEDVDQYIENRLGDGGAKASINRTLQLLKQAYTLAELPAPKIRRLDESDNVRCGFFSETEIRRVMAHLPDELADSTLFAWLTGMRKGEIASLRWEDVDGGCIRLRAENAKNETARLIPLEGELAELIARRKASRQVKVNGTVMLSALIFHRHGEPIAEFRKSWARASCKAGVGEMVCPKCALAVDESRHCANCGVKWRYVELKYQGKIFHDLRRSACKNMIAAGVAQATAMKLSGHKTDSMFPRHATVDETDLRTAFRATQQYLATAKEKVVAMASG